MYTTVYLLNGEKHGSDAKARERNHLPRKRERKDELWKEIHEFLDVRRFSRHYFCRNNSGDSGEHAPEVTNFLFAE